MAEPTVNPPDPITADPAPTPEPVVVEDIRSPFDVQAAEEETAILEGLKAEGFTAPGVDIPDDVTVDPPEPKLEPVALVDPAPAPAPVVDPAPEPVVEDKKRTSQEWKLYRQANKDRKAAEATAAAETARRQALEADLARRAAADPDYLDPEQPAIDDPLTKMQKDLKELNDRQARQEQQAQADRLASEHQAELRKQEEDFTRDNPDYRKAMTFLIDSRKAEYEAMGLIDHGANQWLINAEEQVKRFATEQGLDATNDDQLFDAARDLAFRTLVQQDRMAIIASAKSSKANVAERVYTIAKMRGYAPAPAPEPVPVVEAEAARGRVQAAMRQQASTTSLSALAPTKAIPETKQIKNREDVLSMTEKEIDYLDRTKPGWDKDIFT